MDHFFITFKDRKLKFHIEINLHKSNTHINFQLSILIRNQEMVDRLYMYSLSPEAGWVWSKTWFLLACREFMSTFVVLICCKDHAYISGPYLSSWNNREMIFLTFLSIYWKFGKRGIFKGGVGPITQKVLVTEKNVLGKSCSELRCLSNGTIPIQIRQS